MWNGNFLVCKWTSYYILIRESEPRMDEKRITRSYNREIIKYRQKYIECN